MWYWIKENFGFLLFATFIAGLFALAVYAGIQDARKWEAYKAQHQCKIVGKESPSTGVGPAINSNGGVSVVVITTPGKTGWLCDDGITYWR